MNLKLPAAIAVFAVLAATLAIPADAQAPRRAVAVTRASQPTVFVTRGEDGRTRTKLVVTPRSYLDGGTEVLPGQRKFTDYAISPYGTTALDSPGMRGATDRSPLNPRWEQGWPRTWY